ncbi:hypothetical protein E1267_04265 [Nonomuraea longispora]|uniref:Uncharacterized protein n=1 Tax=Nonomuraea longispora TaxID=1848320 RepID=A0A4R4NT52_9ACTN|nr:DUF6506 family protein [Nonomuraea longispora]TDC10422.1 hypothetical protein E1267_04265 [Nonomuraea longispora]
MADDKVIIFEAGSADPTTDALVIENASGRTRLRAVEEPAQMLELVSRLVAEGVDQIELCGGFGALPHADAVRAVGGRVPVGAIYYGFESLTAIASFKARYEAGDALSEAFIIVHEGADPATDRVVLEKDEGGTTTVVGVPDTEAAAELAGKMAADLQLIELYGTPGPDAAAPVIRAVEAAAVPVGVIAHRR